MGRRETGRWANCSKSSSLMYGANIGKSALKSLLACSPVCSEVTLALSGLNSTTPTIPPSLVGMASRLMPDAVRAE